ncbi:hypothetical protein AKJ57_04815 [candidate division MSBL1 archaeon SCGC-AAA259A05]|uniref:Major facilitator superfamily (MFS) profile domain-containing protein n=1 Tax=candidate division MSBL1 archaeon SCGC-AAA259A05 TaxID=1698259 RepID=A0A133U6K5_9EURY|nr:hypothetical protein AKJ57_04815 [candidate division MSBL1 archaeon SCGC-AAA259A05]
MRIQPGKKFGGQVCLNTFFPAFMTRFGRGKIPLYTFIVGWSYTLSVPLAGFLKDELGMISIFLLTLILAVPLTILIALLWRNYPEEDPGKRIRVDNILSEYKESFKEIRSAKMIRACGFSFLFFMGFGISLSLFPLYLSGIGLTSFLIGVVQFSRMSCGSSVRIFSDSIVERLSQEKTLTIGALIVGLCMTIIPQIENLFLIVILSVIWGLSGGLYSPIVFELIADSTKAENRGKGMGLRGTFGTLGSLIGVLSFSNIAEILGIPLAISATGVSFVFGTVIIETLLHISD